MTSTSAHPNHVPHCTIRAILLLLCTMGLAPSRAPAQTATRTVTIPGTVVTIELARLPALDGAAAGEGPASDGNDVSTASATELWMATTETTWDALDVFVYGLDQPAEQPRDGEGEPVDGTARPTRPYIAVDRGFGHPGFAALSVSPLNARSYCAWLSDLTGLAFRLPTVAEWQAACRAGGPEPNASKEALAAVAWYRGNARYKTHPVGTKPANPWGLHDLAGNVSEWAVAEDGRPLLMGGSYMDGLSQCGCDRAREDTPVWNASDPNLPKSIWWLADGSFIGFRVVCEGPLEGAAVSETPAAPGGGDGEGQDDADDLSGYGD